MLRIMGIVRVMSVIIVERYWCFEGSGFPFPLVCHENIKIITLLTLTG